MFVLNMTLVKVFALTDIKKAKIRNGKMDIKPSDLNWAEL